MMQYILVDKVKKIMDLRYLPLSIYISYIHVLCISGLFRRICRVLSVTRFQSHIQEVQFATLKVDFYIIFSLRVILKVSKDVIVGLCLKFFF